MNMQHYKDRLQSLKKRDRFHRMPYSERLCQQPSPVYQENITPSLHELFHCYKMRRDPSTTKAYTTLHETAHLTNITYLSNWNMYIFKLDHVCIAIFACLLLGATLRGQTLPLGYAPN